MTDYQLLLTLICIISGKPCQIARPLLCKNRVVSGRDIPCKMSSRSNSKWPTWAIIEFIRSNIGKTLAVSWVIYKKTKCVVSVREGVGGGLGGGGGFRRLRPLWIHHCWLSVCWDEFQDIIDNLYMKVSRRGQYEKYYRKNVDYLVRIYCSSL